MSAQLIFDTAPLGAIIRYSDGSPHPPERHRRKLQAWERRNNTGRLVNRLQPPHIPKALSGQVRRSDLSPSPSPSPNTYTLTPTL